MASLKHLLALALLAPSAAFAQSATLRPEVEAAVKSVHNEVVNWRRDFHAHPELSNREERTAKVVAAELTKLGLKPRTGIAHHGVVAIIEGGRPGPRIALRADMDALPVTENNDLPFASKVTTTFNGQSTGVMHACGHDAHTAILLGVAKSLAAMRKDLPGQIMLIFQPSEEGAPAGEEGGASLMIKEGLFKDFKPEAVFGLHVFANVPAGTIAVRSGPEMAASDFFDIEVTGRQTHGARPWGGVDPIVAGAAIVTNLQTIVSRRTDIAKLPAVLTIGAFNGGIRNNIIPDKVKMLGTLRTFDPAMRRQIIKDMNDVVTHSAQAIGATAKLNIPAEPQTPATVNNPDLTAKMLPSLRAAVGATNVTEPPLQMGAEDFGVYALQVPSLFFFVGATDPTVDVVNAPSNHSPFFMLDERSLDVGVRSMLQVSLDYLNQK